MRKKKKGCFYFAAVLTLILQQSTNSHAMIDTADDNKLKIPVVKKNNNFYFTKDYKNGHNVKVFESLNTTLDHLTRTLDHLTHDENSRSRSLILKSRNSPSDLFRLFKFRLDNWSDFIGEKTAPIRRKISNFFKKISEKTEPARNFVSKHIENAHDTIKDLAVNYFRTKTPVGNILHLRDLLNRIENNSDDHMAVSVFREELLMFPLECITFVLKKFSRLGSFI